MLKSKSCPSLQDLEEMALTCNEWSRDYRIRLAYIGWNIDVPKENESENGTLNILPKKKRVSYLGNM